MNVKSLICGLYLFFPLLTFCQNNVANKETTINKRFEKFDTIYSIKTDTLISFKVYRTFNNTLFCEANLHKSKSTIEPSGFYVNFSDLNSNKPNSKTTIFFLPKIFQTGSIIYYDTLQKKNIKMTIENGYLNGNWMQYYSNGNIMVEGKYEGHAKTEIWKWYYNNEVLMKKGAFFPDVIIYSYKITNSLPCTKYGKYYKQIQLMEKDSAKREILEMTNNRSNFDIPYIINYRTGEWEIWDKNGVSLAKKTYNKVPCEIDKSFDTFQEFVKVKTNQ